MEIEHRAETEADRCYLSPVSSSLHGVLASGAAPTGSNDDEATGGDRRARGRFTAPAQGARCRFMIKAGGAACACGTCGTCCWQRAVQAMQRVSSVGVPHCARRRQMPRRLELLPMGHYGLPTLYDAWHLSARALQVLAEGRKRLGFNQDWMPDSDFQRPAQAKRKNMARNQLIMCIHVPWPSGCLFFGVVLRIYNAEDEESGPLKAIRN